MTTYSISLILAVLAASIFIFISFFYFQKLFLINTRFFLFISLCSICNITIFAIFTYLKLSQAGTLVLLISIFIWLKLLYRINTLTSLLCATLIILLVYISKGIGLFVLSLIFNVSISAVFENSILFNVSSIISICFALFLAYFSTISYAKPDKVKLFFNNRLQEKFVLLLSFALLIYLMLVHDGQNLQLPQLWFEILYIESYFGSLLLLFLITNNALEVSYLIESDLKAFFLQNQLERQLHHYRSHQKCNENFKIFRHDYNNIMNSIRLLLDTNEIERAKLLFDDVQNLFQNTVKTNKDYSNNLLVDAILFDTANICEYKSINFSANVYLSKSVRLEDLDLVRIFSNLIDNAIDSTSKINNPSNRFINIMSSSSSNNWLLIEFLNSYEGDLKSNNNNRLLTTKENVNLHGLGINIVTNIIEKNGGIIEILSKESVFSVKVLFPLE
ncbi:GHKL domain-containing protein [Acetobacterium paludosum]|uniref:GHKL domain-containing protein n=1 Tax=Acetobacterium paludosum TaxID=52693 RepID=A0A923HWB2_9FIRM|nr:GHKL domain-containing protein [Acetobacterium paludosum]MBC3887126.1 GHKL domain-containing protein [Acetobacterium paludosum]